MYSPHAVHFMENGAMRRTVCTFGPAFLGPRVRWILEGSKSGGKYLVKTLRSDIVDCGNVKKEGVLAA